MTLSGATAPGQSGAGSDGNEEVLCIPKCSNITEASPSDCVASYLGHSLVSLTPLQRCSQCILQPQPTRKNASSDETHVLENWEASSSHSLLLYQDPLRSGGVIYVRIPSIGQELFVFYGVA